MGGGRKREEGGGKEGGRGKGERKEKKDMQVTKLEGMKATMKQQRACG